MFRLGTVALLIRMMIRFICSTLQLN